MIQNVLITGANGFVGAALCRELAANGIRVVAVVRSKTSDISRIKDIEGVDTVYCELSDIRHLPQIVNSRDIDVFYHMAWQGTSGNLRADSDVQTDNVRYTCDAVRACGELGCSRFVYASSIMEYEIINIMNRGFTPGINTVYSTAKLAAEYMSKAIANSLGINHISGIISNIYGPGENTPRLINSSLRKLLKGEHCSFSSGEQMYDFIYIDDAARAFSVIGGKGLNGKRYYIGSSKPQPLKEFLIEMRDQVDPDIELGLGELPAQPANLTYNEFDINELYTDTGFIPEIVFSEGIRRTIEYLRRGE